MIYPEMNQHVLVEVAQGGRTGDGHWITAVSYMGPDNWVRSHITETVLTDDELLRWWPMSTLRGVLGDGFEIKKEEIFEELALPDDWDGPDWTDERPVNNWKLYIPEPWKEGWGHKSIEFRKSIAIMAHREALDEKWD